MALWFLSAMQQSHPFGPLLFTCVKYRGDTQLNDVIPRKHKQKSINSLLCQFHLHTSIPAVMITKHEHITKNCCYTADLIVTHCNPLIQPKRVCGSRWCRLAGCFMYFIFSSNRPIPGDQKTPLCLMSFPTTFVWGSSPSTSPSTL